VVAVNRFSSDSEEEIQLVLDKCDAMGVKAATSKVHEKGGEGGLELSRHVIKAVEEPNSFEYLYPNNNSIREKIEAIAKRIYGAQSVSYTERAIWNINQLESQGHADMPICVSKTQKSLSDDPTLLGRPQGFTLTVEKVKVSAGAGFLVVMTGKVLTMPGLPRKPAASKITVDDEGVIKGLF